MNPDGSCPSCGKIPQIGEWPFDCRQHGHAEFQRIALLTRGRGEPVRPVNHFNPISKPVVTRDWMERDGTLRPMKPDQYDKRNVPGLV